jgi:hypothetical protein
LWVRWRGDNLDRALAKEHYDVSDYRRSRAGRAASKREACKNTKSKNKKDAR